MDVLSWQPSYSPEGGFLLSNQRHVASLAWSFHQITHLTIKSAGIVKRDVKVLDHSHNLAMTEIEVGGVTSSDKTQGDTRLEGELIFDYDYAYDRRQVPKPLNLTSILSYFSLTTSIPNQNRSSTLLCLSQIQMPILKSRQMYWDSHPKWLNHLLLMIHLSLMVMYNMHPLSPPNSACSTVFDVLLIVHKIDLSLFLGQSTGSAKAMSETVIAKRSLNATSFSDILTSIGSNDAGRATTPKIKAAKVQCAILRE
jgi:hypothetical protein